MECLDLALQAPTGSNRQGWQWVFVEDQAKKDALAEIYRANFDLYRRMPRPEYEAGDPRAEPDGQGGRLRDVPLRALPRGPADADPVHRGKARPSATAMSAGFWGSLLPAVWSFMLALRERGMGSAWTTLHLIDGGEAQAAELLGIPVRPVQPGRSVPDRVHRRAPTSSRPSRLPASEVTHWDGW